jgi:peptidoglycan-associated lipoprotein
LKAVVNFGNDSSALDAAAKSAIEKIAEKINNSSASVIYLYGYTDVRGDAAYNLGLSKRRAQSVSDYLRPLLTNLTLQVAWRGAKNPAASGNSEADYAKNRRVEIWAK